MHAFLAAYRGASRRAHVTPNEEREHQTAERKELERRLALLRQKVEGRQHGRSQ